jgi:hypothetical protein
VREIKRGGSQSNCKELFPGRKKEWGSHCEKSSKKNEWRTKTIQTKMELFAITVEGGPRK